MLPNIYVTPLCKQALIIPLVSLAYANISLHHVTIILAVSIQPLDRSQHATIGQRLPREDIGISEIRNSKLVHMS